MKYICLNENDTLNVGAKLGQLLCGGDVVTLHGDLGVGKTVFTKGIAHSLGITEDILSPTFTVMNEYDGYINNEKCANNKYTEQRKNNKHCEQTKHGKKIGLNESAENTKRIKLCHYDAYRLKNGEEAVFAGVGEFIGSRSTICVIEWPDNIVDILPSNAVKVIIERHGDDGRIIEIFGLKE